jgi:predicted DsbA family dithiol-disulfide isomerase
VTPVSVELFTDPACPFAFSAEPVRQRLRWHYGDGLSWTVRMIVLTLEPGEAGKLAQGAPTLQRRFGMPIDPVPYAREASSEPACRAGRYTAPTYLIDGVVVPGFNPIEAYEVVIANAAPGLARRPAPASAREVLDWAPEPLATAEIALIMQTGIESARRALGEVGRFEPAGADGYWTPASG